MRCLIIQTWSYNQQYITINEIQIVYIHLIDSKQGYISAIFRSFLNSVYIPGFVILNLTITLLMV